MLTSLLLLACAQNPDVRGSSLGSPAVLTIRAVGDVMLGTGDPPGYLPPNDGADSLADVADWLRDADLTFVNLEGPLCDEGESHKCKSKRTCYAFRVPTRYGAYLADAGVDVASVANNHINDFGEACRKSTEKALDELGIGWSGPKGTVASTQRNGLSIALVAFHTSSATNDVNDLAAARELVKGAAQKHDVVLVSFHGGAEGKNADHVMKGAELYLGENRGDLRAFARAVIDSGADLVIGHGPHVLRGLELYRGRLVAYSLGNFATYGRFNLQGASAVGAVLHVELARDGSFVRGRVLPTRQVDQGLPRKDGAAAAVGIFRALSQADFGASAPRIGDDGEIALP